MVRQSSSDKVTVVGAGITLMHAMQAADTLAKAGINVRVVDPFTVKPIDRATLLECAKATGGRVITVEDHYPEGRRAALIVTDTQTLHLQTCCFCPLSL